MLSSFVKILLVSAAVVLLLILLAKIPQNTKDSSRLCLEKSHLKTLVLEIQELLLKAKQDQNPVYSLIHVTGALCKLQLLQLFGPKVEKIFNLDISEVKAQLKEIQASKIEKVHAGGGAGVIVPDKINFYA